MGIEKSNKLNIKDSLIHYMCLGIKETHHKNIGMEAEHFILRKDTGEAVPYSGKAGVGEILHKLMKAVPGSEPLPGKELLGFTTPDYVITLEPAAQLEISIRATEDINWIEKTYHEFLKIFQMVLVPYDYEYFSAGTQPVSRVRDLKMIPKERYRLMDQYFAQIGNGGIEMMRGTCSVQASIDYYSEDDFRKKIQAISFYAPVFKLLTNNASLFEGKEMNHYLVRTDIWNRTDPLRCGVLPGIFKRNYGFDDYADYLIQMPLIYMETQDGEVYTGHRTVQEIYGSHGLSQEEIMHIQSMAFPDVRVKQYLEIRVADAMPIKYTIAYCALIKGLIYSEEGLSYAIEQIQTKGLTEQDIRDTEQSLMNDGWNGISYGEPIREMASQILLLAGKGLTTEERKYLNVFEDVIKQGGFSFEDRRNSWGISETD